MNKNEKEQNIIPVIEIHDGFVVMPNVTNVDGFFLFFLISLALSVCVSVECDT